MADLDYLPDVKFKAYVASNKFCQCDGCHAVGEVKVISIPKTLYYDGQHLTTRYTDYWLCSACLAKLREAIR